MNLMEVMVATLLFSVSAGSSMRIWSLISSGEARQRHQQQQAERLEAELASQEALLRQQALQATDLPICGQGADRLVALLKARPARPGVLRRITRLDLEDGVLVELASEGASLSRQRLYRPAALGLCLPFPVAAPLPAAGGGSLDLS